MQDARAYKSGHGPAIDDYLLTGKLFCGHCKNQMTGTSGTSKSGKTHRYYQCKAAPRKCDKKNVQKENIENIVFKRCQERITDELIDEIVANIIKVNESDQDSIELVRIRKEIRELESKIEKLLDQMEAGAGSDLVIGRLEKRGEELEQLKKRHSLEKNKQITIDPEVVRKFLKAIRKGNIKDLQYKKMLVKVLIDKVYLYDDHVTVILQNNGSKKTDSENSIDVIGDYFSGECSGMNLTGAP